MPTWNFNQAEITYRLPQWSDGYFNVNAAGHLCFGEKKPLDLYLLAQDRSAEGLSPPLLVRLLDVLEHRIERMHTAFAVSMNKFDYQGAYLPVYPIKVNQQRMVVETISQAGANRVGLEAGSKAELIANLALAAPGQTIICNGYKDHEYIRLALLGGSMGLNLFLVIEKLDELRLILELSESMNLDPQLGIRIRLSSSESGNWQNSGGEKSKFGFSPVQIPAVIELLRQHHRLHWLRLLHVHLGSQITELEAISKGLLELSRYFVELHALGAAIEVIDVGGGLAIDYEGTQSEDYCSCNYSVEQYAEVVVAAISAVCHERQLAHPRIITESGRYMTAHHAFLITQVLHVEQGPGELSAPNYDEHWPELLKVIWHYLQEVMTSEKPGDYPRLLNDFRQVCEAFARGELTLTQRIHGEQLYYNSCRVLRNRLQQRSDLEPEQVTLLDNLNETLADKYFCNFSLFQSLPDAWGIKQIFPIMPLHRLDELPSRRGIIQDLTCDSDGRIDNYVDEYGVEKTLPLHPLLPGQPYYLGFFLLGAYQEILGDMHNLFGDTHAVNIKLGADGEYQVLQPQQGETAADLLAYVHFDVDQLKQKFAEKIGQTQLNSEQKQQLSESLLHSLNSYTYLVDESN